MNKQILESKQFSNHPDDAHLTIVLAKIDNLLHPYVTWMHNSYCGGYYEGHYCKTLNEAVEDFSARN